MQTYDTIRIYMRYVRIQAMTICIIAKTMHSRYLPYMLNKFSKIRGGQMSPPVPPPSPQMTSLPCAGRTGTSGEMLITLQQGQMRDKVYQLATRKGMQIEHFLRRFWPIHVNLARYLTIESGGKAYPKLTTSITFLEGF